MSKRERIEDLGRIAEMAKQCLDEEVFCHVSIGNRLNHLIEYCKDEENCRKIFFSLDALQGTLYEIQQLARYGEDDE